MQISLIFVNIFRALASFLEHVKGFIDVEAHTVVLAPEGFATNSVW